MARDRYVHNDDLSDVTTPVGPRRVEFLTGPERRRRWPDETKIAIVAEALAGGVVVSDVARVGRRSVFRLLQPLSCHSESRRLERGTGLPGSGLPVRSP